MAATAKYDSWVEGDDTTPLPVTHGLVFYKNAGINFGDGTEAVHNRLVPLASLDGLAYTVAETTSSATSYQIGVVNDTTKVTYARLVWVPSAQVPKQEEAGVYTGLENGLWWANNVWVNGAKTTPFAGADGSQGKPKALNFFIKYFGDDAKVDFFGLSEGLSNENTSTVTSLTFEGENVPLGNGDDTPFSSDDVKAQVAAATAPLNDKIDSLEAELKEYKADHQTSNTELKENWVDSADGAMSKWKLVDEKKLTDYAASHPLTNEAAREGYVNTGDAAKAKWNLVDVKNLTDYTASHPLTNEAAREGYVNTVDAAKAKWKLVDGASLVTAQNDSTTGKAKIVSISGTEKVGKTVTAKSEWISGASHSYAWYVGGKLVKHATKSTLKLTRSMAHHALSVWVTTTWTDANGAKKSVSAKSKYLRTAYIAR